MPPPSRQNRDIPPELERIVLKALARDVEDRHRSALELFDDLQGFLRQGGLAVSRNEVGEWMRDHFAEDIAAERVRDEEWRQAALPALPELNASAEPGGPGGVRISRPTVPLGPR